MLTDGHIFSIKTKDPQNVAAIKSGAKDIILSGLNVLKDQIRIGDFIFIVLGGDKPKDWNPGLVGLAHISQSPFDEGYDGGKNYRVAIDIDVYFEPSIVRGNLVTYPDTFDIIGIGPNTKWEPNQAITSVSREKAVSLLHAICDLREEAVDSIKNLLGEDFTDVERETNRYVLAKSKIGQPTSIVPSNIVFSDLKETFRYWLTNVYPSTKGSSLGPSGISSYVNCLSFLTDEKRYPGKYDERSTAYWYNMYHYLYGKDGPSIYTFSKKEDVVQNFGALYVAVTEGTPPADVDVDHFNAVRAWSQEPAVKKASWVPCSFTRYFEFLEWLEEERKNQNHSKLSSQKVEQEEISVFSDFVKCSENDVASAGFKYAEGLIKRFICAQLAKPLVVLTGLSGSGKTKLAQAFTDWIAIEKTSLLVPVGADWTNSEHLLGYPDALQPGKYVMPDTGVLQLMLAASDNSKLPFFLILDEMNLSHVERYFADFLSAMESGDEIKLYGGAPRKADDGTDIPPTLKFPPNLFVIGTMNVDETTYMFSPKVLDRAQVIEFRVSEKEMQDFLANPTVPDLAVIKGKGAKYAEAFLKLKDNQPPLDASGSSANKDAIAGALNKFFPELAKLGAEFGYRTAGEVVRFCAYYIAAGADVDSAIDAAIVQKLLPKLHGSQARLGPVLRKLKELASKEKMTMVDGEQKKTLVPHYKLTCDKIERMQERLKANGFTSFAEA